MANLNIFQRYSQKENAVTNNVLLLFSRLYENNPIVYNQFFNSLFDSENLYDASPSFSQQVSKGGKGVIDGFIQSQSSKIVIETKRETLEKINELVKYADRFNNEDIKILIHLSKKIYAPSQMEEIKEKLKNNSQGVSFFSLTFKDIDDAMGGLVESYPYDKELAFLEKSFKTYCETENLFSRKKYLMRAVTCGNSKDLNRKYNFYFDPLDRGFQPHKYLGIYYEKCVHLIGEIKAIVHAEIVDDKLVIKNVIDGELTEVLKSNLEKGMREYLKWGWGIKTNNKFFLCEEMYETTFRKSTKYGIFSSRYFDLREYSKIEGLPKNPDLAEELKSLVWE